MSNFNEVIIDFKNQIIYLETQAKDLWNHFHHKFGSRFAVKSVINVYLFNKKIQIKMGQLSVPTGTPVTGSASPVDAKGNVLPNSAFKTGSCKFSTSDATQFTVAPGATEEQFVVTETTPGSASTGNILFDAQDVNGNQLPQASASLAFTAVAAVAVGSVINFDQTSHA